MIGSGRRRADGHDEGKSVAAAAELIFRLAKVNIAVYIEPNRFFNVPPHSLPDRRTGGRSGG